MEEARGRDSVGEQGERHADLLPAQDEADRERGVGSPLYAGDSAIGVREPSQQVSEEGQ